MIQLYTTIIVKPGEDLKKRARDAKEKFVRKNVSIPASGEKLLIDSLSGTSRHHFDEAHYSGFNQ
jgi:hypothetical protein